MIPPSFIQDLIARADIVDIVGRYVQLKKAGINYKGLCPFHGEKSPSFIVSPTRQTYHCFGCGVHGNAVGFMMEHAGLGFIDAVKDLAQQMGVVVPEDDVTPEERARAAKAREQEATLTEVLAKAAAHWRAQLKASPRAIDYLKGRGLTGEIAARFGLGYAPPGWHGLSSVYPKYDDALLVEAGLVILQGEDGAEQKRYDRFRERIMFPIRNVRGDVIGFGGRVLDGGEPKYLNSPETPVFVKGRELYGLYEARAALRERGYALVTEGYMDVVALAQLGFANAVATLGTACTSDHIRKLVKFTDRVVFSFDGDAAGRRAAGRALEAVLPHATDTRSFLFLFLPPEHDPDSYVRERGTEAFEQCVAEAVPLSRQLLEAVREGCDLDEAEGRAQMLSRARPLFEQLPAGLLREQMLAELARLGQLSAELVLSHWERQAVRSPGGGSSRESRRPTRSEASANAGGTGAWSDEGPPPVDEEGSDAGDSRQAPAYDPYDDGTPDYVRREAERSAFGRRGSSAGSGSRWPRKPSRFPERPTARPTLSAAATDLDRAVWLLVHRCEAWDTLGADAHVLLSEQPAPYGPAFSVIERELHEHGAVAAPAVLDALRTESHADLAALVRRVESMLDPLPEIELDLDLQHLVNRLLLQSLDADWKLWQGSSPSSDADMATGRELNAKLTALRLLVQRGPGKAAAD